MIITFICNAEGCPNEGIVYRMEDSELKANCGGCWAPLQGTIEQEEN